MGTAYFNRKDVVQRLNGTICFYDGKPYYVWTDGGEGSYIFLTTLPDAVNNPHNRLKVEYTDPKFCYKSPQLGYLFHNKKDAVYVSRLPDRNQSQGLSQRVLYTQPALPKYSHWMFTTEMEDMLLGRYAGLATAKSLLSAGLATSVPISKDVAIAYSRRGLLEVYYKGRPVACNLLNRGMELYDITEKSYMTKLLSKSGIILGV